MELALDRLVARARRREGEEHVRQCRSNIPAYSVHVLADHILLHFLTFIYLVIALLFLLLLDLSGIFSS